MSMTDSDKTSTKKYKEKDIPELYLLRDADKATYLDPAEAEADKTSTETKRAEIPVLYPDDTSGGRSWRTDEHKGLDERLAERNENWNKEPLGGSPMDYMDAPISKAYAFLAMPDRDVLQKAISRIANKGDKRADLMMTFTPKARDEFTTAMWRDHKKGVPIEAKDNGRVDANTVGEVDAINLGSHPEDKVTHEVSAWHERDHDWADQLKYQEGMERASREADDPMFVWNKEHSAIKAFQDPSTYAEAEMKQRGETTLRDKLENLEAFKLIEAMPEAVGADAIKNMDEDDMLKYAIACVKTDPDTKNLDGEEIFELANTLLDVASLKLPKRGGKFQTKEGGILGINNGVHGEGYAKSWNEAGTEADMMEGSANINGEFTSPALARYWNAKGITQDDVFYGKHLNYDPQEELDVAKEVRKSPEYKQILAENNGNKTLIPTFKYSPDDEKFFKNELEYMEKNGGDHTPEWYDASFNGLMGDGYGPLDEDEMQLALDKWNRKFRGQPHSTPHTPEERRNFALNNYDDLERERRKNLIPVDEMDVERMADEVLSGIQMSPSYITRYHATDPNNARSIMKEGLKTSKGDDDVIYTSVNPNAFRYDNEGNERAVMRLRIPKEDYRRMTRLDHNPSHDGALGWEDLPDDVHDIDPDLYLGDENMFISKSTAKDFKTIPQHGRTDVFADDIKPEWIDFYNPEDAMYAKDQVVKRSFEKNGMDGFIKRMQEYETKLNAIPSDEQYVDLFKNKYNWNLYDFKYGDPEAYHKWMDIREARGKLEDEYPDYLDDWKDFIKDPEAWYKMFEE